MELKNMREAFPKMPVEIEKMIAEEVEKQMKSDVVIPIRKHRLPKKSVAVLAMVIGMSLATTVLAAVGYYMHLEKVGEYGVETHISPIESEQVSEVEDTRIDVPEVVCEVTYVPDGMIEAEEQKYGFSENPFAGGLSFIFYAMDMGDDAFKMLDKEIAYQENLTVAGKDAIYLEMVAEKDDEEPFKKMYVFYSDVHYVMELFISQDVTKEEAIKFAEGIILRPATEADTDENIVSDYTWSTYLESLEEVSENNEDFGWTNIAKDKFMTHNIGEEIEVGAVNACVEKVEIFDNINVLLPAYVDNDLYEMGIVDNDGNLLDAQKEYYKRGDGISSVDELIKTESVPLKLVYVTVSYTNDGSEDLKDVIFNGSLVKVVEEGEELTIWEQKYEFGEMEYINLGYGGYFKNEMFYYDVHGGEQNNNYIPLIKAGETVNVHMGFIVTEEMLSMMYLNLDNYSGGLNFSENALEIGYVDIRQ